MFFSVKGRGSLPGLRFHQPIKIATLKKSTVFKNALQHQSNQSNGSQYRCVSDEHFGSLPYTWDLTRGGK